MKIARFIPLIFCIFQINAQSWFEQNRAELDSLKKVSETFRAGLYDLNDSSFNFHRKGWHFALNPDGGYQYFHDQSLYRIGADFQGQYSQRPKIRFNWSYRSLVQSGAIQAYSGTILSAAWMNHKADSNLYLAQDLRFRFKYMPNRYVNLETGIDQQHLGSGDRSLLIDDHSIPAPFAMIRVKLWKFDYRVLQQIWREGVSGHYLPKANTTHTLSFQHKHKFTFSLFETVTSIIKDTLYNRGFDPEYLNPLIVYRPQEYSLGSSDNVILGFDLMFKIKRSVIYTQMVMDEFLLSSIRSRNRWWANKYGVQVGVKWTKTSDKGNWFARSEFNLMRPYTFAHLNKALNYGNQGSPIAHPLGANFIEWYQEVDWNKGKTSVHLWTQLLMRGEDSVNGFYSYGADIYRPYILHTPEFGVKIGNGEKQHSFTLGIRASRLIGKSMLSVFVEPRIIFLQSNKKQVTSSWISAGFQSRLWQRRTTYQK